MDNHWLVMIQRKIAVGLIVVMTLLAPLTSYAEGWQQREQGWQYLRQDRLSTSEEPVKNQWLLDQGLWYHLDGNGWMQTGWYQDSDGHWYYLNRED